MKTTDKKNAITTEIGKIKSIHLGIGGYQEAQFGLSVELGSENWSITSFQGFWSRDIKCDERCKWTEKDRDEGFANVVRRINQLLIDAKKDYLDQLVGVPVEVTFENRGLKSWRILTEVI